MIQLDLCKDASAPISFSLSKVQKYIMELYWESPHDLDVHAIGLNSGKIVNPQDILSTYNSSLVEVNNPTSKHVVGAKEAFRNENASLIHNGDSRTGIQLNASAPDEVLVVDLNKLNSNLNEVSFFITNHPPRSAKFNEVNNAKLVIKDDSGKALLTANLTNDFDAFDMVQMGSLLLNPLTQAWEFNPVAVGVNGDFNSILGMLQ